MQVTLLTPILLLYSLFHTLHELKLGLKEQLNGDEVRDRCEA